MRAAELLADMVLNLQGLTEARVHAFVFAKGATEPEHRFVNKTDEYELADMVKDGIRTVILDPDKRQARLYPRTDEFRQFLDQHAPSGRLGKLAAEAERKDEITAGMRKKLGYQYQDRPRHNIDPEEERDFRSQIAGGGMVAAKQPSLGGTVISTKGARGAQIVTVEPGGVFAKAGLRPKDSIMAVNKTSVRDAEHFKQLAQSLAVNTPYELRISRRGKWYRAHIVPQA